MAGTTNPKSLVTMHKDLLISIVIPTCNRRESLLRLLYSLTLSHYPVLEVIIVDAGENPIDTSELAHFSKLKILYIQSDRSVCIQRNLGIQRAKGDWIFLCDDDLEVPPQYLSLLTDHIKVNENVGAVSGLVLQMEDKQWSEQYPIVSSARLLWNFIFQLSIWGEIKCETNNLLINKVKHYYKEKGNHISRAGWPVLTDFAGEYFRTPVYGLGASLVKKNWLLLSPYDEVLDANGIGDNFGVALGFPNEGIHVLKTAVVYHHRDKINRPANSARYFKRILALDYFVKSKPQLQHIHTAWFIWSLIGNVLENIASGNLDMIRAALKSTLTVLMNRNPYLLGARTKKKVIDPTL